MKSNKKIKDYEKLLKNIKGLGLILPGTITERIIEKNGRFQGPYYQWTYKKHAKTVTVNLSARQVDEFRKAIKNNKALEEILKNMRALSLEILNETTEGVIKRKPPQTL